MQKNEIYYHYDIVNFNIIINNVRIINLFVRDNKEYIEFVNIEKDDTVKKFKNKIAIPVELFNKSYFSNIDEMNSSIIENLSINLNNISEKVYNEILSRNKFNWEVDKYQKCKGENHYIYGGIKLIGKYLSKIYPDDDACKECVFYNTSNINKLLSKCPCATCEDDCYFDFDNTSFNGERIILKTGE